MIPNIKRIACALGAAILAGQFAPAQAGWTGVMNGTGRGWAGVNVGSGMGIYGWAQTDVINLPSAAMAPANGYTKTAPLPLGSSPYTLARVKGEAGYVWRANTSSYNGDATDNVEIQKRANIKAAFCPSLSVDTVLTPDSFDGEKGTITVTAQATAGAAALLTGWEIDDPDSIPVDDPNTPTINETMDYLRANGKLRFENFMIGPFEYGVNGKCELVIPFSIEIGDLEKFVVTSDGMTKSLPIEIQCPPSHTVECDSEYEYPPVTVTGGCGPLTVSYDPPVSELQLGVNQVTATVTDEVGNEVSCGFIVAVVDTKKPVIEGCPEDMVVPSSESAAGQNVSWTAPTASDGCGLASFTTSHESGSFFPIGATIVTITAQDDAGNTAICTFTVTVEGLEGGSDSIPPAAPRLAPVSAACGSAVTLPTPSAVDNISGLVAGTTSTVFPITQSGTTVVRWTFTDESGNSSVADQNVTIAGNSFLGFYSPIEAKGGSCASVAREIPMGRTLPIKFRFKCGQSYVTSGPAPLVKVQRWSANCEMLGEVVSAPAVAQGYWVLNPSTSGWSKGIYKIIVVLPDNSEHHAFIKLN